MDYIFKPGDRVMITENIDDYYETKGKTATVVYNDKGGGRQYALEVYNFDGGHSCEGHVKSDRGLWASSEEIKLIGKPADEKLYTREEVDAEIAEVKAQMIKKIKKFLKNLK